MSWKLAKLSFDQRLTEAEIKSPVLRSWRGRLFVFNILASWAIMFFVAILAGYIYAAPLFFCFVVFALTFDIDKVWRRIAHGG